jgi:histidinol dehydrogenase
MPTRRLRLVDASGRADRVHADLPRPRVDLSAARDGVAVTLQAVRERGDAAVAELNGRFDGQGRSDYRVPQGVLRSALADLDPDLRAALERAVDQVRWFHERARPADWSDERGGARMGQWHRAVQRAGVYVPGGKAAYPSTVVMTVVPAQVAGVESIVLCTPPTGPDGWPDRTILATAALVGVTDVYAAGGAQAIAAMGIGTASIDPVDIVVGPGNLYVSLAKQQLAAEGLVGTDGYAGPTEVAIVADDTADPVLVAADLVAQAEHDELATALLVTTSPDLVDRVERALEDEVAATRHRQRVEDALAGQGTAIVVGTIDEAVIVAEQFAAEHLEVHTRDAEQVARRIRYAGTTFIGASTPVSLGDYASGPNHTLPTSGTARFAGGLSTATFMVPVNWVAYDDEALAELAPPGMALSAAEDLPAHGRAVAVRIGDGATGGKA